MIINGQRTIDEYFPKRWALVKESIRLIVDSGFARERRDDEEREGEELLKYLIIYSHYMRARVQPRYTRIVFAVRLNIWRWIVQNDVH